MTLTSENVAEQAAAPVDTVRGQLTASAADLPRIASGVILSGQRYWAMCYLEESLRRVQNDGSLPVMRIAAPVPIGPVIEIDLNPAIRDMRQLYDVDTASKYLDSFFWLWQQHIEKEQKRHLDLLVTYTSPFGGDLALLTIASESARVEAQGSLLHGLKEFIREWPEVSGALDRPGEVPGFGTLGDLALVVAEQFNSELPPQYQVDPAAVTQKLRDVQMRNILEQFNECLTQICALSASLLAVMRKKI